MKRFAQIAAILSTMSVAAVAAHAMDYATACSQGSIGACMIQRISLLFAMLGGWN